MDVYSPEGKFIGVRRPMNGWLSSPPSFMEPTRELMPYCVTILRAVSVAFWMSLAAPEDGSLNTTSSAARPPMA